MIELLKSGGIMMIPLIISSIIGIAIIIERLFFLKKKNILPSPLVAAIHHTRSESDLQNLKTLCHNNPSILSELVLDCLEHADLPTDELKEYMEDQGRHAARILQRGMGALEAIGGTAPLMGLLGTIFGMIKVFDTIQSMGVGQAKALSGGISEALITTATGLIIAIPVLMAYYYLNGKVEDRVLQIERNLIILITKMKKVRELI
jgi:biopolymer transport protein ExbB